MQLTVDLYITDPFDEVQTPWQIEWNYGSKIAAIRCRQPYMEWPVELEISPFATLAGVKQTLELVLRTHVHDLTGIG